MGISPKFSIVKLVNYCEPYLLGKGGGLYIEQDRVWSPIGGIGLHYSRRLRLGHVVLYIFWRASCHGLRISVRKVPQQTYQRYAFIPLSMEFHS